MVDRVFYGGVLVELVLLDLLGIIGLRVVVRNDLPLDFVVIFNRPRMNVVKQVLDFDIEPIFEQHEGHHNGGVDDGVGLEKDAQGLLTDLVVAESAGELGRLVRSRKGRSYGHHYQGHAIRSTIENFAEHERREHRVEENGEARGGGNEDDTAKVERQAIEPLTYKEEQDTDEPLNLEVVFLLLGGIVLNLDVSYLHNNKSTRREK